MTVVPMTPTPAQTVTPVNNRGTAPLPDTSQNKGTMPHTHASPGNKGTMPALSTVTSPPAYTPPSSQVTTYTPLLGSAVFPESSQAKSTLRSTRMEWEIPYEELSFSQQIGAGAYGVRTSPHSHAACLAALTDTQVVYRGSWRESEVAIKRLKGGLTEAQLKEFRDEAQLMAGIRPHKVPRPGVPG